MLKTRTASEILEGIDLVGTHALVTGVSSGIGAEIARVLVLRGADVMGTARDLPKARLATAKIHQEKRPDGSLDLTELDLASLRSVRACTDRLLAAGKRFDVVIANAGVMAVPEALTADGFEIQFGTNYLGHFVFLNRIAPIINRGGRVVMIASAAHRGGDVDLSDLNFDHSPYDPLEAYSRAKTATILFAVEFDRRHKAAGIRATAVHPGAVLTETTREMIARQPEAFAAFRWRPVEQGAATSAWTGFVAHADEVGGRYCEDCHVATINDDQTADVGVRSYALDPDRAKALWIKSEELVGECFG